MKTWAKIVYSFAMGLFAFLVIAACTPTESEPISSTATSFETIRAEYRNWTAIQETPVNVSMMLFTLCRLPSESEMGFA